MATKGAHSGGIALGLLLTAAAAGTARADLPATAIAQEQGAQTQGGQAQAAAIAAESRAAQAAAAGAIASMEATAARVRVMLRRARARGHRDEIACVDEGLSRADVAVRHAREEAKVAADAYARPDVAEARRAMTRVMLERDAARNAASVADACFAGDASPGKTAGTQVSVLVVPSR